jgi:hypothetical protein
MRTATMTVRVADGPEVKRLLELFKAEHHALHAYLVAGLLHTQSGHHWSDLLEAHDAVAGLISGEMPDRQLVTGRYRPCSKCGGSPDIHNPNRGPDFIGHEYA